MNTWTRKEFLKASLVGGGAAMLPGSHLRAAATPGRSANGDIRVAVVGLRAQGRGHMLDHASKLKGSRLVAICDVDSEVLAARKKQGKGKKGQVLMFNVLPTSSAGELSPAPITLPTSFTFSPRSTPSRKRRGPTPIAR